MPSVYDCYQRGEYVRGEVEDVERQPEDEERHPDHHQQLSSPSKPLHILNFFKYSRSFKGIIYHLLLFEHLYALFPK